MVSVRPFYFISMYWTSLVVSSFDLTILNSTVVVRVLIFVLLLVYTDNLSHMQACGKSWPEKWIRLFTSANWKWKRYTHTPDHQCWAKNVISIKLLSIYDTMCSISITVTTCMITTSLSSPSKVSSSFQRHNHLHRGQHNASHSLLSNFVVKTHH